MDGQNLTSTSGQSEFITQYFFLKNRPQDFSENSYWAKTLA